MFKQRRVRGERLHTLCFIYFILRWDFGRFFIDGDLGWSQSDLPGYFYLTILVFICDDVIYLFVLFYNGLTRVNFAFCSAIKITLVTPLFTFKIFLYLAASTFSCCWRNYLRQILGWCFRIGSMSLSVVASFDPRSRSMGFCFCFYHPRYPDASRPIHVLWIIPLF